MDWEQPYWEGMVDKKLDISQPFALATQKTKHVLGCIKRSVSSRVRELILPLCSSLGRPHPEFCIQLWGHWHRKDMNLLNQVQRRPPRWCGGWNSSAMKTGWERWVCSIWRRLQGDLDHLSYRRLQESWRKSFYKIMSYHYRTRENDFKLKKGRFKLDVRKKLLTVSVLRDRNRLPRKLWSTSSLEAFKVSLDAVLSNLVCGRCTCPWERGPFQADQFKDSMKWIYSYILLLFPNLFSLFFTKPCHFNKFCLNNYFLKYFQRKMVTLFSPSKIRPRYLSAAN